MEESPKFYVPPDAKRIIPEVNSQEVILDIEVWYVIII